MKDTVKPLLRHFLNGFMKPVLEHICAMSYFCTNLSPTSTMLGALAAVTIRIAIGPFVACTSFRPPTLLAKMADALDEITSGRFILGLGAGWHQPEYEAFGYPFNHLAGRFEEALQVIVPLLREGYVDFQGSPYYSGQNRGKTRILTKIYHNP